MQVQLQLHIDEARRKVQNDLKIGLVDAATFLKGELIEEVSKPGSGLMYPVPGTKNQMYQASAPGEPPAVMLGNLRRNITFKTNFRSGMLEVIVGVRGVPYAKRLEFGFIGVDKRGRRYNQAPRPFFRKTYEKNRYRIIQKISG